MIYACLKKAENGTEEFMYQFFIQPASVKEKEVWITDLQDVNHIRNVLRMKKGEKISLCCEEKGKEYICSIEDMQSDIVKAVIVDINGESRELPVKITLRHHHRGLPPRFGGHGGGKGRQDGRNDECPHRGPGGKHELCGLPGLRQEDLPLRRGQNGSSRCRAQPASSGGNAHRSRSGIPDGRRQYRGFSG